VAHVLIGGVLVLASGFWSGGRVASYPAILEKNYPVRAVRFIREQGWAGRKILNHYDWGGLMIWNRIPVFVDGRADLYGDDFLLRYFDMVRLGAGWQHDLADASPDLVFFPPSHVFPARLILQGGWKKVYEDAQAVLLANNHTPAGQSSRA